MNRPEETHDEHHAQPHDFTGPLSPGVKRLLTVFGTGCVLLLALDFFITRKTHAPGEGFPGFYAIYGFVGCVFLVLAAKWLRKLVMRADDYWDPEESGVPNGTPIRGSAEDEDDGHGPGGAS